LKRLKKNQIVNIPKKPSVNILKKHVKATVDFGRHCGKQKSSWFLGSGFHPWDLLAINPEDPKKLPFRGQKLTLLYGEITSTSG